MAAEHSAKWEEVEGSDGNMQQITVAEDPKTGDYTRLTRFQNTVWGLQGYPMSLQDG